MDVSSRLTRRGLLAAAGAAVVVSSLPAVAQDGPIRISHVYGETVLDAPAKRVVSLGYTTQDSLLALGVVPVALRHWYGPFDNGVWPWAQDLLGDARPEVLAGEPSAEVVAGLAPDLIVAIGAGLSQAEYLLLSRIAPVIVQPPGASTYGTAWQDEVRMLAVATGRVARGDALIAEVEQTFADARARHPDWQGRPAAAAWHDGGQTGVFMADDTRGRFLRLLGFEDPAGYAGLTAIDGFYATMSPEDLSPIDADLLVWISAEERAGDIAQLPMRRTLAAHREGREVFAGLLLGGAMSFGSILSLPWALREIEPQIVAALDGDPATPVSSAVENGLAP